MTFSRSGDFWIVDFCCNLFVVLCRVRRMTGRKSTICLSSESGSM